RARWPCGAAVRRAAPIPGRGPGLSPERADDGALDRLRDLPALPGDRPRRFGRAGGDGSGDASAIARLFSAQVGRVRSGRWLDARGGNAPAQLRVNRLVGEDRPMDMAHVIDWSREALRMALVLGGPPL